MRRVCVVITARPSYSRVKSVLTALKSRSDVELQIVVAASAVLKRFGEAIHYIEHDGFKINARVQMVVEGDNLLASAKSTGLSLLELPTLFDNLGSDVVLTIADRYETLATSVAAAYLNIPLAHLQGGEVSGSIDEKVRHANTKLADIHFVATDKSKDRVLRMGEDPVTVFNTGCPSIDLAVDVPKTSALDFNPYERYGGVGAAPDLSKGYAVVMQHPVTTEYGEAIRHMQETLFAMSRLDIPVLWFWPNVDAGSDGSSNAIRTFRETERDRTKQFHFFRNMEPIDFLKLIFHAKVLVGNSSVGIRESAYLGVPVVNIGSRQRGRERGKNVLDVDYSRNMILEGALMQIKRGHYESSHLYGDGASGPRIAELLATQPLKFEKILQY